MPFRRRPSACRIHLLVSWALLWALAFGGCTGPAAVNCSAAQHQMD